MNTTDSIKLDIKAGDKVKAIKAIPNYFDEGCTYEVVYAESGFVKLREPSRKDASKTLFVGAEIFNRYFVKLSVGTAKHIEIKTAAAHEDTSKKKQVSETAQKPVDCKYVTKDDVYTILENATIEVETVFDRCTQVTCKLPSGFIVTASSTSASVDNYDEDHGVDVCMQEIEHKVWELETYRLMTNDYIEGQWYDDCVRDCCDDCDDCELCYPSFYGRQYR